MWRAPRLIPRLLVSLDSLHLMTKFEMIFFLHRVCQAIFRFPVCFGLSSGRASTKRARTPPKPTTIKAQRAESGDKRSDKEREERGLSHYDEMMTITVPGSQSIRNAPTFLFFQGMDILPLAQCKWRQKDKTLRRLVVFSPNR